LVPQVFGAGWTINFARLFGLLRDTIGTSAASSGHRRILPGSSSLSASFAALDGVQLPRSWNTLEFVPASLPEAQFRADDEILNGP
jgi:hypothetical protein